MNAIEIKELTKTYKLYERNVFDRFVDTFLPWKRKKHKEFHALKDVNLIVKQGEILGIVGRNGAGKSTLLKIISGITQPTSGSVIVNGRIVALLELGGGFNQEYTGFENIYFTCALQGMSKKEIDSIYKKIVDFSELEEFINIPVKKYSSGMKARLGFAISINVNPEILILDEILAVGDEYFKNKCLFEIKKMFESGITIIYVSHSLKSIETLCTKAEFIDSGEIILSSTPKIVCDEYWKICNEEKIDHERINKLKKINSCSILKKEYEKRYIELKNRKEISVIKKFKNLTLSKKKVSNETFSRIEVRILKTNNNQCVLEWGKTYLIEMDLHLQKNILLDDIYISVLTSKGDKVTGSRIDLVKSKISENAFLIKKNIHNYLSNGYYCLKISIFANGENCKPIYKDDEALIFKVINSGDENEKISLIE